MLIAGFGLVATAAAGAMSGALYYSIIKEDKKKMKKTLRAYLETPELNYEYNQHGKYYILTAPAVEQLSKVKIKETEKIITCQYYLQFLQDLIPIYSFKYDKDRCDYYDIREEVFFSPNKGKEITELTQQFNQFIIEGQWKNKVALPEKQKKVPNQNERNQKETDPDIRYHLKEIEKKVQWLQSTGKLEIEDSHKVDVLKEDAVKIMGAYCSFRDETKLAFKEKAIQALIDIETKLNDLSIQQEKRIMTDMDKTISLIKKR